MVIFLVMFGGSAIFLGRSTVFSGQICSFLRQICGFLLQDCFWPINYAFFCCWTTFTLEIIVLLSYLPLTEHVQTLYLACADIIDPVCDSFDG